MHFLNQYCQIYSNEGDCIEPERGQPLLRTAGSCYNGAAGENLASLWRYNCFFAL
jgi:hypothetical protein